ncbi:hypothetical protein [Neorhodopirellula lusitana]|uniref:hypothetical protein n=1 Tax=Neorhodopirellula lusitana TaxID=445327 RepID=UPI00384A574C
MDRLASIKYFCLSNALLFAIAGCGGGTTAEPAPTTSPATAENAAQATSQAPTKELTGGMTLPDEVPIQPSSVPADSETPGSTKGMQLPDDLSP